MDIGASIFQLIRLSFPPNTEEQTLLNYKTYLMRVLNLRLSAPIMDDQEAQSELARMQNKNNTYRLQELITRLTKSKLKKRGELNHFLLRVHQLSNKEHNQTIDTIFKSQDVTNATHLNTSQFSQLKKSVMEVEQQPTLRNQNQKPDTADPLIKTIRTISDKGNLPNHLSEEDLIKDVVFCLQGIEGQHIVFDPILDMFAVKKDVAISIPSRKLINLMCESGWLFKKIQTFLNQASQSLIIQALQNAIKEEMSEYYRLIAYFENLVQEDGQLTLRKIYLWIRQPISQLTQINQVISTINSSTQQGSTAALVISTLQLYSRHGCPIISALFQRQLSATCIPFIRYINQWVFDGTMDDIANEFFVEREEIKIQIRDCGELWKKEFKVNQDKIPTLITFDEAYKIFDTGRVVNWLRKQCQHRKWHLEQELATIDMLNTSQFKEWVNKANEISNRELVSILFNQFKFNMHLQAVKRYLLLGQGEFIHTLMEILQQELSKPAINVYKHTLLGLLESAVRASNVQYLPQEVNLRLNVKLLEPSQNDTGWEIFCLDYQIDEPINTIFNGKAMLNYLRIFNFLWRVKRVEFTLGQCWKQHLKFQHIPNTLTQIKKAFQLSHQMLNEMQHFIQNFYSYVMVEAVESAWKKFVDESDKIKNLDSLIKLHEGFQQEVQERAFLTQKTEIIQKSLLKLFELIFRFKSMQESLMANAKDIIETYKSDERSLQLSSVVGMQKKSTDINKIQSKGVEIIKLLLELRKQYRDQMFELLEKLKKEDRLKFLQFKLDFNEYYQNIKESKLFQMDLNTFIGKCLPKQLDTNSSRSQSQKSIISQPIIQQLQQQQPQTYIPQPQQLSQQRSQTGVHQVRQEYIDQVRSVKEGLKLLDEQRRQMLNPKPIDTKPPLPIVQQQQPTQQPASTYQLKPITPLVTEHEKNKNDEIFDEEDSEIEDYDNPKYQYDDDDSDDNLV